MSEVAVKEKKTTKPTTGAVKKKAVLPYRPSLNIQVLETTDYSLFSMFKGNRDVSRAKVDRLKQAMEKNPLHTFIDVNEKMQIIDGQHRFTAWKELGMPVYFIIRKGWGLKEMHTLNQLQTTFRAVDYLPGYKEMGYEDYIVFGEFMDQYGFNFMVSMALLSNTITAPRGSGYENFKNGTFKIADLDLAHQNARKITDYAEFYDGYKRDKFCFAVLKLFKKSDYNHEEMMEKLKIAGPRLHHQPLVNDYLIILQREYNKGKMDKNKVHWAKFE
jgi:hypothetical protein